MKLPLTTDGLKAARTCYDEGIATNVTLCFSPSQALLAAKAGATYISPFVGRLDDISTEGMALIQDIRAIYDNTTSRLKSSWLQCVTHSTSSSLLWRAPMSPPFHTR